MAPTAPAGCTVAWRSSPLAYDISIRGPVGSTRSTARLVRREVPRRKAHFPTRLRQRRDPTPEMPRMAPTKQQVWIATKIAARMERVIRAGKDNLAIMRAMADHMPAFHQLLNTSEPDDWTDRPGNSPASAGGRARSQPWVRTAPSPPAPVIASLPLSGSFESNYADSCQSLIGFGA